MQAARAAWEGGESLERVQELQRDVRREQARVTQLMEFNKQYRARIGELRTHLEHADNMRNGMRERISRLLAEAKRLQEVPTCVCVSDSMWAELNKGVFGGTGLQDGQVVRLASASHRVWRIPVPSPPTSPPGYDAESDKQECTARWMWDAARWCCAAAAAAFSEPRKVWTGRAVSDRLARSACGPSATADGCVDCRE